MTLRSFQAKLVYLTVAVLVLLQAATLIAVHVAGQRTMRRGIGEELRVGSRVLDRLLAARGEQLSQTVRALASDFAFRETVAIGERPTITEALENHASRVHADAVFLVSLDGNVVADTLKGRYAGKPFPLPSLVREAEKRGKASAIVTFDEKLYQLVVVPVLGPRPIAWVSMGFEIDEPVLNDVRRLTSLDVSLRNPAAAHPLLVSTLRPEEGDDSQVLLHPLQTADGSRIEAVLQRSIAEAQRPYRRLELQIFALSTLALIAAVIAAF